MSADLERMSLDSSSANSLDSDGRPLSVNVKKLHNSLNLLLTDVEREQFIHCLNIYHSKRNVFDLVQTLKVILNTESKRQLLPMLRLVIPRSDQLLFDQYTSEGLYLKSDLLPGKGSPDSLVQVGNGILSANPSAHIGTQPEQRRPGSASPLSSPSSFSIRGEATAPSAALCRRVCVQELPAEIRQVTLKRHKSNEGLGFSIRGGSEHGVGIYVSLVESGSLAEKEGLRVGDQILKVNEKVFDRVTHAEAVKVLKGCKKLCMSVCSMGRIPGGYITNHIYTWVDPQGRSVSPPLDLPEHQSAIVQRTSSQRHSHMPILQEGDEKRVNLVLDDGCSLGLMIRGGAEYALGIYITGVDRGSAAALGGLKVGDQILEVNGRSFLNIPHDEAVQVLKTSRHLIILVKDVGRLPHARTVVDETRWVPSSQIAENSASNSVAGMTMDSGASASAKPIFYKGLAGSQVTLSSLATQPRAMLEEQARLLLTEAERQTLSYYLEEYRETHIGIEQLVMALFELFNTHAKFSLMSEVRGLVTPRDLEQFDGLVLYHEIEAIKAQQGGADVLNPNSISMEPQHNLNSYTSYQPPTSMSSARNGSRLDSSSEGPLETHSALLDIFLDDVQSAEDSPPSFKPPPPPRLSRHPSPRVQPKRPSSACSQMGLFFNAPSSGSLDCSHMSPTAGLTKKEVAAHPSPGKQQALKTFLCPESAGKASPTAPSPPPALVPPVSAPASTPPLSSPTKPVSSSPASKQSFIMVDVHRPTVEPAEKDRGAIFPQLADGGQTLSEDSGVDIAESGGLNKHSSPRAGKPRPPPEAQGAMGAATETPSLLPGVLEPTSTLVRIARTASTLGIAIEGGANTRQPLPRIVTIQKGGSAYKCGQLRVGQVILEVNGISLRGRVHQEAARLIAEAFKTKERDHIEFLVTEFNVAL